MNAVIAPVAVGYQIIKLGDPRLLQTCESLLTREEIKSYHPTMAWIRSNLRRLGGVGLAAPQIGILKRFFVADLGMGIECVINPQILDEALLERSTEREGCLSIPGITAPVTRPTWVQVKYEDWNGSGVERKLEGYPARVFLHENDHLNGVLIVHKSKVNELVYTESVTGLA